MVEWGRPRPPQRDQSPPQMTMWDLVQLVWGQPELEALPLLGRHPMVEHTSENQERRLERVVHAEENVESQIA
ncbi:hypothetical protein Tco_1349623 [Tanacetum coccineum]